MVQARGQVRLALIKALSLSGSPSALRWKQSFTACDWRLENSDLPPDTGRLRRWRNIPWLCTVVLKGVYQKCFTQECSIVTKKYLISVASVHSHFWIIFEWEVMTNFEKDQLGCRMWAIFFGNTEKTMTFLELWTGLKNYLFLKFWCFYFYWGPHP